MKLKIATDEVELTPDIKELVDKKLSKGLDKYLASLDIDNREADLLLSVGVRWGFTVKLDMVLPGGESIHVNEKRKELHTAINSVARETKRLLRKYKEKHEN